MALLPQHVLRLERLIKEVDRDLEGSLLFIAFAARPATLKVEALAERLAIDCGGLYIKSPEPCEAESLRQVFSIRCSRSPLVTDAAYVLTQYDSTHSHARTLSEPFIFLKNRDENRTTEASISSRSSETWLTLELICPPKPESEGPPGSRNL